MEVLQDFGDPDLAARFAADPERPSAAVERQHAATLARESTTLWVRTHDDPLFVKALLLASPSASARFQAALGKRHGPRNRALRLVEYMLFRYLARAASRTTPNGLWAGVTTVRLGAANGIEACAPAARFTPDLAAFQSCLRALAARDEYRRRAAWRLNPTLSARPGQGWTFLHRAPQGALEPRSLGEDAAMAAVLERLATAGPASLTEFAAALAPGAAGTAWLPMLNQLVMGGVLVGGLDLPQKFSTPWEALEQAAADLLPAHTRAWQTAIGAEREQCDALADAVWSASPARFAELLAATSRPLDALCAALELPPPSAPVAPRCDLRLPWRLVVDRARFTALADALADYDRHWQCHGSAATAERAARRSAFAAGLGDGLSLAEAAALAAALPPAGGVLWQLDDSAPSDAVTSRLARWRALLGDARPCATLGEGEDAHDDGADLDLAPHGCWLAGLDSAGGIRAHGVSDLPTMASARLGGLLDLARHDRWLARALRLGARGRAPAIEYLAPFEANPNALLGPALLGERIAPWRAARGDRELRGARLVRDTGSGLPVLALADGERRCVLSLATANLPAGDPLAEALLWTGHRDSTGRARHAIEIPLTDELHAPRFTPRVLLPGGATLSARRTVLGADVAELRRRRGAARFGYWLRLARRYDWPAELEVGSEHGGMMRVPRDSPLALEALCKGLVEDTPYLVVREAAMPFALAPGRSHLVELAMPFLREPRA
ncbi:MAG: lantibiotic dehydratase [Gammaproteobacteria bacterium]